MAGKLQLSRQEQGLLEEVGRLSDRIRVLRGRGAMNNGIQIKALEAEMRTKWGELRSMRAGPMNVELQAPRARGHYQ